MKGTFGGALASLTAVGSFELRQIEGPLPAGGVIPSRAVPDAAHIAVATVGHMGYLLTWNCKHLANAQIIRRISVVCNSRGYDMPVICTPEELMGD